MVSTFLRDPPHLLMRRGTESGAEERKRTSHQVWFLVFGFSTSKLLCGLEIDDNDNDNISGFRSIWETTSQNRSSLVVIPDSYHCIAFKTSVKAGDP